MQFGLYPGTIWFVARYSLVCIQVQFGLPEKKFGPAEDEENTRVPRKILQLVEEFSVPPGEEPR